MARLDEFAVTDIIERYASGEGSLDLSIEYGVSVANIRLIVRGDSWKHVPSDQREAAKSMCWENMLAASRRANAERSARAHT